ncbi:hypothetical protein D6825_01515 [Candidatus Woesearchaeota archaeon]|nr:MAG: hypothetical protein D6825_01515 [Candidatus Woesearchaeota archaeon]
MEYVKYVRNFYKVSFFILVNEDECIVVPLMKKRKDDRMRLEAFCMGSVNANFIYATLSQRLESLHHMVKIHQNTEVFVR